MERLLPPDLEMGDGGSFSSGAQVNVWSDISDSQRIIGYNPTC